jgi:hypothetical protein
LLENAQESIFFRLMKPRPSKSAQGISARRDSTSARAATSAARRTGLEVRSERMRSRCNSSSCFCRSRFARSTPVLFWASRTAPEPARSADNCCSSIDLLSHPRAMSVSYVKRAGEDMVGARGCPTKHLPSYPGGGDPLFKPFVSSSRSLPGRSSEET